MSEGLDASRVEEAEKEKAKLATAPESPASRAAHWRVENLRSKLAKLEARAVGLRQRREALGEELGELGTIAERLKSDLTQ
eukprot:4770131-Pyramimonas_sp.AAC.1